MITVENDRSLRDFNTFGLDVKCHRFIEYTNAEELALIVSDALPLPLFHIGRGSNILFTKDFEGSVLHSAISFINNLSEDDYTCTIEVGAGVVFDSFCDWAADRGLWGIENLSLIPGEIGAAAVQNIGAYGCEIKDVIKTVSCFDTVSGQFVEFDNADCKYGYRDSIFKHPDIRGRYIITSVKILLHKDYSPKLSYKGLSGMITDDGKLTPKRVRDAVIEIRNEKLPDPASVGSAGSFFKNPVVQHTLFAQLKKKFGTVPHYDLPDGKVKIPAAWLIEQCGWKGFCEGNVAIWEKQPLVIVNRTGYATATEILDLERRVTDSVYRKFNIELQPEVDHI